MYIPGEHGYAAGQANVQWRDLQWRVIILIDKFLWLTKIIYLTYFEEGEQVEKRTS